MEYGVPGEPSTLPERPARLDIAFSTEVNHSNTPASAALIKSHLAHFDIISNRGKKMNTKTESISSPKRLARIAGVFYLLVGITGGFAEGFVDPKMYVAGNAAATAGNVSRSADLSAWASSPTWWMGSSLSSRP